MWLHHARYRHAAVQRDFDWVNTRIPHRRDPGGSPFQMPARLADGLGLESDLDRSCLRSCAPSSDGAVITFWAGTVALFEEFGSPALTFRKESQLRLLLLTHTECTSHELANCQAKLG
jgi:hypothetical protein